MLAICDNYAKEYSISFNAMKSKLLVVLSSKRNFYMIILEIALFMSAILPLTTLIHLHILGILLRVSLLTTLIFLKGDWTLLGKSITCYVSLVSLNQL